MTAAFGAGQLSYSKVRAMTGSRRPRPRPTWWRWRSTAPPRTSTGSSPGTAGEAQHGSRSRPHPAAPAGRLVRDGRRRDGHDHHPRRSRCDRARQAGDRSGACRSSRSRSTSRTRPAPPSASTRSSTSRRRTSNPTSTPRRAPRWWSTPISRPSPSEEPGRCELEDGTGLSRRDAATTHLRQRAPARTRRTRHDARHRPAQPHASRRRCAGRSSTATKAGAGSRAAP